MKDNMVFGVHPVEEVLAAGNEIDRIFIVKSANHPGLQKLSSEARDRGISVKAVPIEKLHRLTRGNHQGVIAFMSAIDFADIESVVNQAMEKDEVPLIVVLDQITDVRNVGAIARSAECCGVHGMIMGKDSSAPMSGDAVKSSAGALLRVPMARAQSLPRAVTDLEMMGLQIIACSEKGDSLLSDVDFTLPTALIMGSEEKGISTAIWKTCSMHAKIATVGEVASLNVSVAAGMALYEILNQRRKTQD